MSDVRKFAHSLSLSFFEFEEKKLSVSRHSFGSVAQEAALLLFSMEK